MNEISWMKLKYKKNAASMKWHNSTEFKGYCTTQLIGYDPDQKVQTNYHLVVVFS